MIFLYKIFTSLINFLNPPGKLFVVVVASIVVNSKQGREPFGNLIYFAPTI